MFERKMEMFLLLFAIIALGLAACVKEEKKSGLPNPASVFCEEQGNRLELRQEEDGVVGICIFPDGTECEEWAYFRGECSSGDSNPHINFNPGNSVSDYCLALGY